MVFQRIGARSLSTWPAESGRRDAGVDEPRDSSRVAGTVRLWNEIASYAIVVAGANAPAASGVAHCHRSTCRLRRRRRSVAYEPERERAVPGLCPGCSVDAAVAKSAHDVLVNLLPAQSSALDAQLAATLAHDSLWVKGRSVGRQAALAILTHRQIGDGRLDNEPYSFGVPGPGAESTHASCLVSTSRLVP